MQEDRDWDSYKLIKQKHVEVLVVVVAIVVVVLLNPPPCLITNGHKTIVGQIHINLRRL